MKVLALCGSSSSTSINMRLLRLATTWLPADAQVQIVSVRDLDAPLFSVDLEVEHGVPQSVRDLHAAIALSDAVLVASPEHNGSMPAMLKNAIDWLSRVDRGNPWIPKPLGLMSTSPGGRGGATNLAHLAKLAGWWGADVAGTFSVGRFHDVMDADDQWIGDPDQRETLRRLLSDTLAKIS